MVAKNGTREAPSALLEAASLLLSEAGGGLLTTNLVKALFYLDIESLLETGKTATNETYVALKAGPVVQDYPTKLIQALEESKLALQEDDNPDYKPVVLLHGVKRKFLSEVQMKILRKIAQWAKTETATAVSVFSHDNPGWVAAWKDGAGKGDEIDLRLAMQQLVDDDPWMTQAWTDEEKALLDKADSGEAVDW